MGTRHVTLYINTRHANGATTPCPVLELSPCDHGSQCGSPLRTYARDRLPRPPAGRAPLGTENGGFWSCPAPTQLLAQDVKTASYG